MIKSNDINYNQSPDTASPQNMNAAASAPVLEPAFDKEACMRDAVKYFIESIPDPAMYTDEELRDGCMNAIEDAIIERNVILGKGNKIRHFQDIPNYAAAKLALFKYTFRSISWTGDTDSDGNMLAYYYADGAKEGVYNGTRKCLEKIIRRFKPSAENKDINTIISMMASEAEMIRPSSDPDLVPFKNGILNYKTKQLLPFSPDICFVAKSSVDYPTVPVSNPHITMPDGKVWDFESFMNSLSDDPGIVDLIFKVIGAILRPNVRWDKVPTFVGPSGMNGKGTICELMRQLLGAGNYASLQFSDFSKDSKVAQLLQVNAVITDENDTNSYSEKNANLKAAVTGDEFTIDRKYMSAVKLRFKGLIVQCANGLPRTNDQTDSFYRRILMIPFDKTFKDEERKYIKDDYLKRPEVLEYVAWRVMNMPDYYELPEPEACRNLLGEFRQHNDPVVEFMNDVFPQFTWEKVPGAFVYDLYLKWSQKNNPSGRTIGRRTVMDRIKANLDKCFDGEWTFKAGDTRINKNDNLQPELLIIEYGLDDWRSKAYKGTDPAKMSMPQFKKSYINMFVREKTLFSVVVSTPDDDDHEDNLTA